MNNLNPAVDQYLIEGCGRCELHNTPQCKVNPWREVLIALRSIILECGVLTEERKWGVPCYTLEGKNVLLLGAFKDCATISFLNGALLPDPEGILEKPGDNTQAARVVRFTRLEDVLALAPQLKTCILQAAELERSGVKVVFKKPSEHEMPEELEQRLDEDPEYKTAFYKLTPGRRRGYLLHISAAKQSKTREDRIEKCRQRILEGKGMQD